METNYQLFFQHNHLSNRYFSYANLLLKNSCQVFPLFTKTSSKWGTNEKPIKPNYAFSMDHVKNTPREMWVNDSTLKKRDWLSKKILYPISSYRSVYFCLFPRFNPRFLLKNCLQFFFRAKMIQSLFTFLFKNQ